MEPDPPSAKQRTRFDRAPEMALGQAIRRERKRCGLSQHQLATKLGITYQQLQKFESGVNRISATRLCACAIIFGISLEQFFRRDTADLQCRYGCQQPETD